MTIENQERRIVYDTDGTSLNYPVPFPFLEPEWLEVSVGTGEIGSADTVLVYGTDYNVAGAGQPTGGMVVLYAPQPVGMKLAISRWVPLTQEEVYPEGGKFPAQTTEDCFDKLTMIAQQLQDIAERSDFLPPSSTGDATDVTAWMSEQVTAAENSAAAAATSETNAAASATAAAISEARAEEAIVDAENAIAIAETSANAAATSAAGALGSETRAYEWAQNPENVSVRENPDTGEDEYSAYHWAKKAAVGTVPTATEADEGVVRFGTAAEHEAGANGVAAQPGRVRDMLFANGGAGPLLREDIMPPVDIPLATPTTPGIVQPDGSTITVDGSGVLSAAVAPSDLAAKLDTSVYEANRIADARYMTKGFCLTQYSGGVSVISADGVTSVVRTAAGSYDVYSSLITNTCLILAFPTVGGGQGITGARENYVDRVIGSKALIRTFAGTVLTDSGFSLIILDKGSV